MPENNTSTLMGTPLVEQPTVLSQTITDIISRAHDGTRLIVDLEADYTNLIKYYTWMVKGIFSEPKTQELSNTVITLRRIRELEAANDANFEERKAA